MDAVQFLGEAIGAVITLGGFIAVIMKFVQPINDLRVVIQKLNDRLDAQSKEDERRDKQIEAHGKQISDLDNRVGKIETKMDLYHKNQ